MSQRKTHQRQSLFQLAILIGIFILINVVATAIYHRFDLTKEKRFTLSSPTKKLLKGLEDVIYVKVYLKGEFPAGFKRLQNASKEMLDEFRTIAGDNIQYEFIDPNNGDMEQRKDLYKQLVKKGLLPTNLKVQGNEEYSEKIIFPGAVITYRGQEMPVHFLQNQLGLGPQEVLNNSISLLEYKLANSFFKITRPYKKKIAFIEGHGEINGLMTADFKNSLREFYEIDSIDLTNTLTLSNDYSAIIFAKPEIIFKEQEKFKIDQYVMNGGKILWLVETLHCNMDSLRNDQIFIPQPYELNLEDQLFKYGVRVNPNLILDLQCNPIPLVIGSLGNSPQTQLKPWYYFPIIISESLHPISKNIDAVMTQFVNSIDTVGAKGIKKTILLSSSKYSRLQFSPVRVHLGILKQRPNPQQFNQPNLPVAVLLEGEFESIFTNRLAPETMQMLDSLKIQFKQKSIPTKMIVISDGDIITNDIGKGGTPYPLGFYRYSQQQFANKDFLTNCIEYMVDDNGLIETRSREVKLRLLDTEKIKSEKLQWQLVNMIVPIVLILIFGFGFNFVRRKKYAK